MNAQLFLAGALFIIMIGMGLDLTLADFKRVIVYPKAVALGLFMKVLAMPVLTFLLLLLFPEYPAELAVGFILLASCPGGATSNVIAGLARSDVALSVTLTALASCITVFTIPLFTNMALSYYADGGPSVELDVLLTIGRIIGVTILPVSLGMLVKAFKPALAAKADKPVRIVSLVLLIIIVIGITLQNKEHLGEFIAKAGGLSVLVNVVMLVVAYAAARLIGLEEKQAVTISIETGIVNGALGIAIASTLVVGEMTDNPYAFPSAIYSLLMYASIGFLIWWGNKRLGTK